MTNPSTNQQLPMCTLFIDRVHVFSQNDRTTIGTAYRTPMVSSVNLRETFDTTAELVAEWVRPYAAQVHP